MDHLLYFMLLALLAEILGTVGGFGSSLFFIPIASYFLDFHSVLGVTALFHVSSNITKIGFFHKGFDKKLAISLGIPAVVFVILGALLSKFIEAKWLEMGLSVFLIGLSLFFLIFKTIVIQPTAFNSVSGGIVSGFIAGLLGTGGAFRGMTLAAFNLKMEVFIATSAIIDLAIDSSRSVVYGLNGFIHQDDLYLIPILLVVSIIGTYIGKKILKRVSEEQFKQTVLVLILITGIITAVRVATSWQS
ncbi:sulfite exporter TauE/SafE family protein [Flavobacterium sp. XGLA_31]|uniref:sulfite exporter TauE/SafE family protein n=1 Tax=Flavobacterium sp. XGLA_31 TaxID=3447666 RepID=UPI003F327B86